MTYPQTNQTGFSGLDDVEIRRQLKLAIDAYLNGHVTKARVLFDQLLSSASKIRMANAGTWKMARCYRLKTNILLRDHDGIAVDVADLQRYAKDCEFAQCHISLVSLWIPDDTNITRFMKMRTNFDYHARLRITIYVIKFVEEMCQSSKPSNKLKSCLRKKLEKLSNFIDILLDRFCVLEDGLAKLVEEYVENDNDVQVGKVPGSMKISGNKEPLLQVATVHTAGDSCSTDLEMIMLSLEYLRFSRAQLDQLLSSLADREAEERNANLLMDLKSLATLNGNVCEELDNWIELLLLQAKKTPSITDLRQNNHLAENNNNNYMGSDNNNGEYWFDAEPQLI